MPEKFEGSFFAPQTPEASNTTTPLSAESEEIVQVIDPIEEQHKEQDLENRASFLKRLEGMPEDVVLEIEFGYDIGKVAHRGQERDDGTRYFEHLRNVALILMDECKISDPDLIVSSLLHDSVEDTAIFGNRNQAYSKWKKVTEFRLTKVFNAEVAEIVIAVTKPRADGEELKTEEDADNFYLQNLAAASPKTLLVKMADRLHNLRSLSGCTPEKQQRKIKETREHYLPIFQKALSEYPTESQYLLDQMEKAMGLVEAA